MKKVVVYPGTFDPITFGHIDVIKKALKLFDKVIIAVSDGINKSYLFNSIERIEMIEKETGNQINTFLTLTYDYNLNVPFSLFKFELNDYKNYLIVTEN